MKEKMKGFIESITVDAATFHNETIEPTYINPELFMVTQKSS